MLTTELGLAGAERVVVNLVHCLRAMGVECAVAALKEGRAGRGKTRALLEDTGVDIFCAGVRRPWHLGGMLSLRRFAVRWRPDVLHCHLIHGHMAGTLLRLGRLKVPTIWTHHSIIDPPGLGRRLFYRLFSGWADGHVFVSEAVRAYQLGIAGARAEEWVVHNGSDLDPLLGLRPRRGTVFGAVGRLVAGHKGFDVLVRAFARVAALNDAARLVIAGEGPDREMLRELIRDEGVADRVDLAGFVDDVAGFLSRVNIFVNPSRWEAFGNTLVEGMAAGLPCIASHVDGLREVGGDCVRWVQPGDVDDLVAAMTDALAADRPPEEAARQREHVTARFGREAMAARYWQCYLCVLGAAEPSSSTGC